MYDFVNGFHDAANAIATTIATRAMSPRKAIIMARTLNFFGGLAHTAVAYTIGKGVVDSTVVTLPLLFAAVVGAVLWGYFTWYFGLPSSSTHALIGGLIGVALFVYDFNFEVLVMSGVIKVGIAMIVAPFIGLLGGLLLKVIFSWGAWKLPYRPTTKFFKHTQVLSAAYVSFTHGMNDAQNAMGIITIALLSAGVISTFHVPMWVRIVSAFVIGLGTSVGGWRIIKTMGSRMTRLHEPLDGCAAEASAGTVILWTSLLGIPISTSQAATGSILGTAVAGRLSQMRWKVIANIVLAWLFTIPGAGLFGILTYLLLSILL